MQHNNSFRQILLFVCIGFFSIQLSYAQNSNDAREVTNTYYIKNAFVVQKPGTILSNTSILIKDGMIQSVGPNINIPFDAEVINADSMYVYAGFIDACSHAGVTKPESKERPTVNDPGNPPKDIAGITPQKTVREAIGKKLDKSMKDLRELGFGFVHVVPRGLMLPGKGSVLSTGSGTRDNTILKENVSQFAQFKSARRMFPGTTIGVMSQFRDLIKNATYSNQYEKSYAMNPKGLERPTKSAELQALYPVVNNQTPVFFFTPKVKDVNRALILQKELGHKMVLTGVKQGWPLMRSITSSNNPVVLSLTLPKEIKEENEDDKTKDKKDEDAKKKKETKKEDDPELKMLNERKKKSHDEYVGQAAMFEKQRVKFSFSTLGTKSKDIRTNILRMIKAGLTENGALAALTTNPASLLGISGMAGTIEQGKIANLFITDKSYFDEKAKIKYVINDGHVKENKEEKKKKKSKDGEPVSVEGTWSYSVEIPGETQSGTFIIKGSDDDVKITVTSSDEPSEDIQAEDVSLDGSNLTFNITVEGMKYAIDIEIDGSDLEGNVTVGEFGSFPLTGSKNPE